MDVQTNKMKLTPKQYLIIFILLIVASIFSNLLLKTLFNQSSVANNNEAVLFNLKLLGEKISDIEVLVKSSTNEVTLKDRLDPSLVAEFGDDDDFLQKVAILKKQIVKRRLEGEVIKLENEKIARDSNDNNADIYNSPYKKHIASRLFEVMMINSSNGIAVIRVEDNIISVKEGDNVQGFVVRKINPDSVVVRGKDGDDEVLGLNYLSSQLYQEKKDDKDVKQ